MGTLAEARVELREWFAAAPRHVEAACDSATDFSFLLTLLGEPRPNNMDKEYFDLRPLIDTAVYGRSVAACYETDPRLDHALTDARAYRVGWMAWMDSGKRNGHER